MIAAQALIALLLATTTYAASETTWDFRGDTMPGQWQVQGWTNVQQTPFGLRIQTTKDGGMLRQTLAGHDIQAVELVVASAQESQALLLWHTKDMPAGERVQLPFVIPASETPQKVSLDVSFFEQWQPDADELGMALPAGANVLIQNITLRGWTPEERLLYGVKSFFHIDEFRPYSINFLWGPLITTNPVAIDQMFEYLPPHGMSVVRFFYFAIAIAAAISLVLASTGKRSQWLLALPIVFCACWLIFDVRMGGEILTYAYRDVRDYALQEPGNAQFRTHGPFYNILAIAKPELMKFPRYALLDQSTSPYYSNLRYATYPSLPIRSDTATGVSLWFVYDRPDIGIDNQGRLVKATPGEATVLASGGRVTQSFDAHSFLYELLR